MTWLLRSLAATLRFTWAFVWRAALSGLSGGAGLGGLFGGGLVLILAVGALVSSRNPSVGDLARSVVGIIGWFLAAGMIGAVLGAGAGVLLGAINGLALAVLTGLWFRRPPEGEAPRYVTAARVIAATLSLPVVVIVLALLLRIPLTRTDSALAILILPGLIAAGYFWRAGGRLAGWYLQAEDDARWAAGLRAEANARQARRAPQPADYLGLHRPL